MVYGLLRFQFEITYVFWKNPTIFTAGYGFIKPQYGWLWITGELWVESVEIQLWEEN